MPKTKFTQDLFDSICEEIAYSNKGLVTICKAKKINASTFYDWVAANDALANKYARARELQADFLADEIIAISDDSSEDELFIESNDGSGKGATRVENKEFVNRSKLRVDSRKWIASKLKPKKYGDKLELDGNLKNDVQITMNIAGKWPSTTPAQN